MRVGRSALLAWTGASLWLSLGTLAALDSSPLRVGTLPSPWVLAVLMLAGGLAGWFVRIATATLWPLMLTVLLWLPWLPLPVPAAFLVWSGPAELVVWLAALGGVLASCGADSRALSSLGRWAAAPRRAVLLTLLLGTTSGLIGARVLHTRIPSGDEPHYLIIAQSLLLDGDLQIENNHQRGDYLSYFPDLRRPDFLRRGVNGQIYSVHAPGLPALVMPAFAIGGYHGVVVFITVLLAIGGALAWHAAWLITGSAAAAWVGWLAVFFSAPVFFHVFTVYPDGAGATFAMAAVWLLVRLEVDPRPVSRGLLAGVGASLAMLPWLHSRFALVATGLGLALVLRLATRAITLGALRAPADPGASGAPAAQGALDALAAQGALDAPATRDASGPGANRWREIAAFLIVPVVSAIGWFTFFKIVYGTFSPAAPYGNVAQNRLATLKPGLPGLFFDQQFGLITNAPIFALAIVGLALLARRHRRLALEVALIAAPYLLAVASFAMWWGGQSAPARFLMILLLPAVIPLAWVFNRPNAVWARAAMIAAALVGWVFTVVRASVNTGALLYNRRDGYDLLLDWLSPTVNLPLAFPSFHRDAVPLAARDTLTWIVVMAVALFVLWLLFRRGERTTRGGTWAVTGGLVSVSVMVACTLVWARHTEPIVTQNTSQLTFLHEWDPDWQPLEVQLLPTMPLTQRDVLSRMRLESTRRGPAGADRPLLSVPLLPAGEYEIVSSGGARSGGTLEVSVGRSTQTIERIDLTDRPAGFTGVVLRLPVLVDALTIRGDETARGLMSHVALRPLNVVAPSARVADTYARRAARYGSARVFFMDEEPFIETPGFWTQGRHSTAVVIDVDEGGANTLLMRAGAVQTTVSISAGEWRASYDLAPGQVQTVELPRPAVPRLFSIATSAAFRPSDIDPKSSDLRELGVWVEFPH